jgi:hypothetical protein
MIWYEVHGRGSGKKMDGVHRADVERPYGKMTTFCGVGISAAFPVSHPRPGAACRSCRKRTSAP